MKKLFALVALLLLISIKGYAYETPLEYMKGNNLTESQANYVLEKSKETRDPDHYIKWFTAIQAHEQGTTFINGTTKYIAGRLKPWMEYKDFKTQLNWWTEAYNKYRYKNNTASDWINKSKYCVTDSHWGAGKGCPNRVKNVPVIADEYKTKEKTPTIAPTQIQNIDAWDEKQSPKQETKTQVKKVCRQVSTIKKDEYIQIDSNIGKFRQWIRNLIVGDKIFICHDI